MIKTAIIFFGGMYFANTKFGRKVYDVALKRSFTFTKSILRKGFEGERVVKFSDGKYSIRRKWFGYPIYRNFSNGHTPDPFQRWATIHYSFFNDECKVSNKDLCIQQLRKRNVEESEVNIEDE